MLVRRGQIKRLNYQDFTFGMISDNSIQESCKPKMLNKICLRFLLNAFFRKDFLMLEAFYSREGLYLNGYLEGLVYKLLEAEERVLE